MYAFFYLILLVAVAAIEFGRDKLAKVDSFSLFNLIFVMNYLMPAFLWALIPGIFLDNMPYGLYYNAASTKEVAFIIYFSYISFVLFYLGMKKIRFPYLLSFTGWGSVSNSCFSSCKLLFVISFFPLVVLLNITLVGDMGEYMAASTEARHVKTQFGIAGYLNYLLSGTLFAVIASLFLLSNKPSWTVKVLVSISFFLLAIGLLAKGGRAGIVGVLIYSMVFLYYQGKLRLNVKGITVLSFAAFSSLFVVYFLRRIGSNIVSGDSLLQGIYMLEFFNGVGAVLLYPFQYFAHYLFVIVEFFKEPALYDFPRLGVDIISGAALIIPGLTGVDLGLPVLPDIISQSVMKKYNGYIPPGWIGWALMDGGVFYLAFKIFFSALICLFLDKSYKYIGLAECGRLVYFVLIMFVVDFIFKGTSTNLFRGNLGQIFFVFMLLFVPFIRIGRLYLVRG